MLDRCSRSLSLAHLAVGSEHQRLMPLSLLRSHRLTSLPKCVKTDTAGHALTRCSLQRSNTLSISNLSKILTRRV